MKRLIVVGVFVLASVSWGNASPARAEDLDLRVLEARDMFREFTKIPEDSIPRDFVKKARGILIFPKMLKGGFLYAAKFGLGVVIVRDDDSEDWSAPAFIRMSGGSFGLQLGADWTDLILIAKSEVAVRAFLQNRFSLGGSLAAVAGPWGRHTELDVDWQLRGAMFSYARSQGLFAAVATDGSVISFDDDANARYYGKNTTGKDIVFDRRTRISSAGRELIEEIDDYAMNRERHELKRGNKQYESESRRYDEREHVRRDEYSDEAEGISWSKPERKRSYEYRADPRNYDR